MKYKNLYGLISIMVITFLGLSSFKGYNNIKEPEPIKVQIITDFGIIKIKLYNETPLHRNNFVKLINQHYYDSLTFHRIIQYFAIQGGNPNSRSAAPNVKLGDGNSDYTIPSEINQKLFHKKGALAAARKNDFENPSKESSGSQFYIVLGSVYKPSMLSLPATRITKMKLYNEIVHRPENKELYEKNQKYSRSENIDSLRIINEIIMKKVEEELPKVKPYTFSDEQIKAYTSLGGTPHLDDNYTVFGEVIEGMDIIEKISKIPVDKNGRPLNDVRMQVSIIK
jgi:cyclophilin family peptidyl-prolyl cis-trans isomerase